MARRQHLLKTILSPQQDVINASIGEKITLTFKDGTTELGKQTLLSGTAASPAYNPLLKMAISLPVGLQKQSSRQHLIFPHCLVKILLSMQNGLKSHHEVDHQVGVHQVEVEEADQAYPKQLPKLQKLKINQLKFKKTDTLKNRWAKFIGWV